MQYIHLRLQKFFHQSPVEPKVNCFSDDLSSHGSLHVTQSAEVWWNRRARPVSRFVRYDVLLLKLSRGWRVQSCSLMNATFINVERAHDVWILTCYLLNKINSLLVQKIFATAKIKKKFMNVIKGNKNIWILLKAFACHNCWLINVTLFIRPTVTVNECDCLVFEFKQISNMLLDICLNSNLVKICLNSKIFAWKCNCRICSSCIKQLLTVDTTSRVRTTGCHCNANFADLHCNNSTSLGHISQESRTRQTQALWQ